ncbi:MAG: CDP-alcohol phosphatidyltransferase family protein [Verrucomicrobiota bacterium]|nr:CDP-alcohol phosphatidyltransferase family protein [Verrucomicrobiota bacterium]
MRRVLILADESADWKVAGLRQLDRVALVLHETAELQRQRMVVSIFWHPALATEERWLPDESRLAGMSVSEFEPDEPEPFDLIVSTRVFLERGAIPQFAAALEQTRGDELVSVRSWEHCRCSFEDTLAHATVVGAGQPWRYLRTRDDIASTERAFLRASGKSQDGLVSRYLNRPLSRSVSGLLLKTTITPNTWSVLVFLLPVYASSLFLRGTGRAFVIASAIYQLYSILDGCDGEIARAKFLQTEFGRRLDSLLDLSGNLLLALCLGVGLARQWERGGHTSGWFYIAEGITAAFFIVLSEGIVFSRRSRAAIIAPLTRWNGALYQRHHEFLERSGILAFGENFAWWIVQLTKRDMAMLFFLFLAAVGFAEGILHLLLIVSAISAALAGNAFLRQPAPAIAQEAS